MKYWYHNLIEPRSTGEDARRREFITTLLLLAACGLAAVAVVSAGVHQLINPQQAHYGSSLLPGLTLMGFLVLYGAARRGLYQVGAYALVGLFLIMALYSATRWGLHLVEVELLFALVIVMAGVVLSSEASIVTAVVVGAVLATVSILRAHGIIHVDESWRLQPVTTGDIWTYGMTLAVITVVSWLSNREIDRSLRRARTSEAALAAERDGLEHKVQQRTRQLEEAQLERLLEMERLAEFGRLSASLLHDVADPLSSAALNLEQPGGHQGSQAVQRALRNLRQLERYVHAMRQQLKHESTPCWFSVGSELDQVLSILQHRARAASVELEVQTTGTYRLFGDPVKFSQIVAHLVANAIEAYDGVPPGRRRVVEIELDSRGGKLVLAIYDWGSGIKPEQLDRLFDPFYSTKPADGRNTGLGLAIVREVVERDFGGTITATSTPAAGTRFVVRLPSQRRSGKASQSTNKPKTATKPKSARATKHA